MFRVRRYSWILMLVLVGREARLIKVHDHWLETCESALVFISAPALPKVGEEGEL
jgi:hypothetical protein